MRISDWSSDVCSSDLGLHAIYNGAFDAPWPKSAHATRALEAWLRSPAASAPTMPGIDALAPLLDALADVHVATDEALPDTGVGLGLERMLSPAFVSDARYGTRCSSVVLVGDGGIVFVARRFGAGAVTLGGRDRKSTRLNSSH